MSNSTNSEIQALRGLAITFAVVSHLGSLFLLSSNNFNFISAYLNFWIGVDIFFCISGYVIAKSLFSELEKQTEEISFLYFSGYFWIKRFWRLAPSAWFWVTLTLILSVIFHRPADQGLSHFGSRLGNLLDAISVFFQVANIHFWQCHTEARTCGVNEFYWSLSLEEQFYIIIPFLFFFLKREKLIYVFSLIAILQLFIFFRSTWTFWGSVRTDGFAIGILLAFFEKSKDFDKIKPAFLAKKIVKYFWMFFWILMILILPSGSLSFNISPFGLGLANLSIAVIIWTASYNCNFFMFPKPLSWIMIFLGNRAYSIYLSHMTAIYLIREFIDKSGINYENNNLLSNFSLVLVFLILMIFLSEFNYQFIEIPFREKGRLYARNFRNRYKN